MCPVQHFNSPISFQTLHLFVLCIHCIYFAFFAFWALFFRTRIFHFHESYSTCTYSLGNEAHKISFIAMIPQEISYAANIQFTVPFTFIGEPFSSKEYAVILAQIECKIPLTHTHHHHFLIDAFLRDTKGGQHLK